MTAHRFRSLALLSLLAAGVPLAGHADTDTANFQVKIVITNSCDVHTVAPTDMDFGSTATLASAINQTSTITVNCNNGLDYDLGLNEGIHPGTPGDTTTRQMSNGTDDIAYQLYQAAGPTTPWGNAVGTDTKSGTGTGSAQAVTVYGQVTAGQATPAADTYTDTVTVTVTY